MGDAFKFSRWILRSYWETLHKPIALFQKGKEEKNKKCHNPTLKTDNNLSHDDN